MTEPHARSSAATKDDQMRRIILALFNPMPDGHEKGCLANDRHIKPRGPCICKYGEAAGEYLWALREAKKIASEHYGQEQVEASRRLEEPVALVEVAALVPAVAQRPEESEIRRVVRALLFDDNRLNDYPIYEREDDRGLDEAEYINFALDVFRALAAQPPAAPVETAPLAEPPSALTADDRAQDLAHSRSSAGNGSEPMDAGSIFTFLRERMEDETSASLAGACRSLADHLRVLRAVPQATGKCPECGWNGGGVRDEGCMISPCPKMPSTVTRPKLGGGQ